MNLHGVGKIVTRQKSSMGIRKKMRFKNVCISTFLNLFSILSHRSFHLIRNQSVQLDCILHRKFFGEWLDEAHDDHFGRLGLAEATAHQVVELLFGDFGNFRFVLREALPLFLMGIWNLVKIRLQIFNGKSTMLNSRKLNKILLNY